MGSNCQATLPFNRFLDEFSHKLSGPSISTLFKAEKWSCLGGDVIGPYRKQDTLVRVPGLNVAIFAWQKRAEMKTLAILVMSYASRQPNSGWNYLSSVILRCQGVLLAGCISPSNRTAPNNMASVDNVTFIKALEVLHDKVCTYANGDIYNMDERALH